MNIAIIGGGNLGQSIAQGLLKYNVDAKNITVTRQRIELLAGLKQQGVQICTDNHKATQQARVIIIAVKPYKVAEILKQLNNDITADKILISVVSDFSISQIEQHLKHSPTIVRAMPNTATSVNESITCLASNNASDEDLKIATTIFKSLGQTIEINEPLMDAATVLGACGIAYVLRFIRGMIQGGIEIGFDAQTATHIATQTVKGASELLLQKGNHPEAEIDKVTTPKGCTIAGLNEMEHQGFSSALIKGIKTSFDSISN
ncbi:MAG: pyrroline-5-carboxylate reductase [Flavobacteriaceae bacterium]